MKKNRVLAILTALLLLTMLLPSLNVNGESSKTISVPSGTVNVRQGPGLTFPVITKISSGENYMVNGEDGDWYKIHTNSGDGWVANWLVTASSHEEQTETTLSSGKGTITASSVRVRKGPGTDFQIVGKIKKGTTVSIIERSGNWVSIASQAYNGWISADYITAEVKEKEEKKKEKEQSSSGKTGTIIGDHINLRSAPSLNGGVLGKLGKNEIVSVISEEEGWVQIQAENTAGWVSHQYIQINGAKKKQSHDAVAKITANELIVHETPSLSGKVNGVVHSGKTFPILDELGNMTKIKISDSKSGWVMNWFTVRENAKAQTPKKDDFKNSTAEIIHDGTSIRKSPNTDAAIVKRAHAGETYKILDVKKNWCKIQLSSGKTAYVAGWIISVKGSMQQIEKEGVEKYLSGKTIVLDPGHGGRDNGTTGMRGTLEKNLTLRTALLLSAKLRAAGANVILTRSNDTYIPLSSRVATAHIHNADAFVSMHYDSTHDELVSGLTTYYYHDYQQQLAMSLNSALQSSLQVKNRGWRVGDYHVIRENKRAAALIELGYLSNPAEEVMITSDSYQETLAQSIYTGLARYFK
ncbi:SH3 domain-containing protein [Peribacillus sp. B-H-3]|uniref:SH3 domain-containing protein n=1 Tax=Peribacillus sp. B-H-3 TaxID=3400420 RepID=UPI003B01EDFE